MNRICPRSVGFAFAAFLGACHAFWAFLVWAGAAQRILDFVFRVHMIEPPFHVMAYDGFATIGLVLLETGVGYVSGWFMGVVWNALPVPRTALGRTGIHEPRHAH